MQLNIFAGCTQRTQLFSVVTMRSVECTHVTKRKIETEKWRQSKSYRDVNKLSSQNKNCINNSQSQGLASEFVQK